MPDDRTRLLEIADWMFNNFGYMPEVQALLAGAASDLRAIASRLQPPVWTRERPSVEGRYWHRVDCLSENAQMVRLHGGSVWFEDGTFREMSDFSKMAEWSGPIPTPADRA